MQTHLATRRRLTYIVFMRNYFIYFSINLTYNSTRWQSCESNLILDYINMLKFYKVQIRTVENISLALKINLTSVQLENATGTLSNLTNYVTLSNFVINILSSK